MTGWNDPVEERTSLVEGACQNYEVLVEDKQARKAGETGPSKRCEADRVRTTLVVPVRKIERSELVTGSAHR